MRQELWHLPGSSVKYLPHYIYTPREGQPSLLFPLGSWRGRSEGHALENSLGKASEAPVCEEPAQHIAFHSVTGPSNGTELNFTGLAECNGTKQYPLVIQ